MLAEIGLWSLILAACGSLWLVCLPVIAHFNLALDGGAQARAARTMGVLLHGLISLSFVCLALAFLEDDFSIRYVASHSHASLPWFYKISAVWGGHEGSLLLWVLILASWMLAVIVKSRHLPGEVLGLLIAIMAAILLGFLAFLVFTSSPFDRLLPFPPPHGKELNPLLQDIGLIIHPPILYMGYVGFTVPFAFAMAALIKGRFDQDWLRWTRPWANLAWAFLTLGITLGSWWAYYELGWGGWWFWDPVENASFMPWLVGTALVHSLAVAEKRGLFISWAVLLAILAFALSLLGTFLVRSGVLTSVHAFAVDPERGLFILAFLGLVVGLSLTLYVLRTAHLGRGKPFGPWSRESFLLINNIVGVVLMLVVLLGTLYPLIYEAMTGGKLSVGPPYFNQFFVPITLGLLLFFIFGPIMQWKRSSQKVLKSGLVTAAVGAVLGLVAATLSAQTLIVSLYFICIGAAAAVLLVDLRKHAAGKNYSYLGMWIAHLGFLMMVTGIAVTATQSVEEDVRLRVGETITVAGYDFAFKTARAISGPNYQASEGVFDVTKKNQHVATLMPQKRWYPVSRQWMTEAGIDGGFTRDLYVALGEPIKSNTMQAKQEQVPQAWGVRVQVKPLVRWLWLGGLLIMAGGMLTVLDKRYRNQAASEVSA